MSQESVYNLLKKNGKMTAKQIKEKLKMNSISHSLKRLIDTGFVKKLKLTEGINQYTYEIRK